MSAFEDEGTAAARACEFAPQGAELTVRDRFIIVASVYVGLLVFSLCIGGCEARGSLSATPLAVIPQSDPGSRSRSTPAVRVGASALPLAEMGWAALGAFRMEPETVRRVVRVVQPKIDAYRDTHQKVGPHSHPRALSWFISFPLY